MMNEEKNTEMTPEEPAQEVFQERVPSNKRTALLRYMTVMFAAAFVLVLMSFLFQLKSHNTTVSEMAQTSASALSRAEELQEENRTLQTALEETKKYVQIAREEGENDVKNTVAAYDALYLVLMTENPRDGDVEYSKAVETVKNFESYLSEEAAALFHEAVGQTDGE